MSAAVNNLVDGKDFTGAYEGLLRRYRLVGQKIQAGQANETSSNAITASNKRLITHS